MMIRENRYNRKENSHKREIDPIQLDDWAASSVSFHIQRHHSPKVRMITLIVTRWIGEECSLHKMCNYTRESRTPSKFTKGSLRIEDFSL